MKEKINKKNIIAYVQGNLRYQLFYSKFAFLIPNHIREQIQYRINSMDIKCYQSGQCQLCGCKTTALQMSNKACDKPCYPEMLSRKQWEWIKYGGGIYSAGVHWTADINKMKFINNDKEMERAS